MSNELLKPLNDLFTWELDALLGLFSCFHHLNHFRYLESLMEVGIFTQVRPHYDLLWVRLSALFSFFFMSLNFLETFLLNKPHKISMSEAHHPFTHEQATPSGDFLEKNHENLS